MRRSGLAAIVILALVAASCGGGTTKERQITLDQIPADQVATRQDLWDYLHCDFVLFGSGGSGTGILDEGGVLAVANDQAESLGLSRRVETVRQLRAGFWAFGTAEGVVLGALTGRQATFCGRR